MGIQRSVCWEAPAATDWLSILEILRAGGDTPIVRMIDNLPAFPDEIPAPDSLEVRISLGGGMITLRRTGPTRIDCLTWGNADTAQRAALERCAQAIAGLTHGTVDPPLDS